MGKQLRALIVEDSDADAQLLVRELRKGDYEPVFERVETAESMSDALNEQSWDVILSDYVMPHFSGLAALELLQKRGIDIPFIVISGKIGEDVAVEAMKAGANDYILKGNLTRLVPAIERELHEAVVRQERRQAQEERDRLMEQLRGVNERLVVTSIEMQERVDEAKRSEAELDAILSSIAEALVIFDPVGKIVRMNAFAEELLGYSQSEREKPVIERRALLNIEDEEGKPIPAEEGPTPRALRGETVRGFVLSLLRPMDNKRIWLSVSTAPIFSADRGILGAVAVMTDITAQHKS